MDCEVGKRRQNEDTTGGRSYIPPEIILNIIPRLPIKSRGRFRCVSKQWYKWISDDNTRRFKVLIRTCHASHPSRISFFSIDQNMEKEVIKGEEIKGKIMGSCNGLVLVQEENEFFLWNPSIGYYGERLSNHELHTYSIVSSGLCFDSNNGDYKALMILSHQIYYGRFVMVGSFQSKTWTGVNFPCELFPCSVGPVLNDRLHLLARKEEEEEEEEDRSYTQILYFDPKANDFVEVPTPELEWREPEGHANISTLCVLDGCLCMVVNLWALEIGVECGGGTFEILVMKEYGVKGSWDILFKIEPGVCRWSELKPLFYTEDKKMILFGTVDGGYRPAISTFDRNCEFCSHVERLSNSHVERLSNSTTTIVYEETFLKPTWV